MKSKIIISILLLGIVFGSLSLYRLWQAKLPLISPIDLIGSIPRLAPVFNKTGHKIVFGFLPYWNMKDSDKLSIKILTHLAYFGIELNHDGSIKKYTKPNEKEPGWNKLNSEAFITLSRQIKLLRKKLILVVVAMDMDQIEGIVDSPESRQIAINSIMSVVAEKNFDGINVDFEYAGHPDQSTRDNFTTFVSDLSAQCKMSNEKCEISLDIFADSAIKSRLYDLKRLNKIVDQVIVMAYDFYRPSSLQSGPVAPLRGKCSNTYFPSPKLGEGGPATAGGEVSGEGDEGGEVSCLDYDVITSIADINEFISAGKIILGIPFYGYQWQTVDDQFMARTLPYTGQTATYKKIQSLFNDNTISSLSAVLSATTLSPYLSYFKDGKTYQIHYEDSSSLKLKIDLVHQSKLGGMAIWALGYEFPYSDLWQTISNNL